jgi:diguanylate cyclase (GGDEF)-like protein
MGTRTASLDERALDEAGGGGSHGCDAMGQGFADAASLRLALAVTERRFAAALRQIERMRRRAAFYARQAARLQETAAKAQRFAYHDELTGLPNRHVLFDRFNVAVAMAARHAKHVALLFLDRDRFKQINDTLGHSAGDQLLQQVAVRLVKGIRASDTACRYGGDEFVVLLAEINGKEGALAVADNLRVNLASPYLIDGASVAITASVGIAVYPIDAHGYDDLMQMSDLAMYRHKARRSVRPSILHAAAGGVMRDDQEPSAP